MNNIALFCSALTAQCFCSELPQYLTYHFHISNYGTSIFSFLCCHTHVLSLIYTPSLPHEIILFFYPMNIGTRCRNSSRIIGQNPGLGAKCLPHWTALLYLSYVPRLCLYHFSSQLQQNPGSATGYFPHTLNPCHSPCG